MSVSFRHLKLEIIEIVTENSLSNNFNDFEFQITKESICKVEIVLLACEQTIGQDCTWTVFTWASISAASLPTSRT